MSENKVKNYIKELFEELNTAVTNIVETIPDTDMATQHIMETVSGRVTAATEGYVFDLYSLLSKDTLKEEIFQDAANANRFYELNLKKQIADAYQFNIQSLEAYSMSLDFKEINRTYATAAAAVGTAAAGGILLGILHGLVHIPFAVVIAGAVLAGIGGGSVTYMKIVPEKNKEGFQTAVNRFMEDLEQELLNWVDDVVNFYGQKVEELKQSL